VQPREQQKYDATGAFEIVDMLSSLSASFTIDHDNSMGVRQPPLLKV
jgi:hypothetical protein